MRLLASASELNASGRKVCVAIGVFDGVHLGHQQVIRHALADAERLEALPVVVTFDRHPKAVVAPDKIPPLIYTLRRRLDTIGALGVEAAWVIPFDHAFSLIPAEAFIDGLLRDFGRVHSISVGSAFTFGHQRGGNVERLKEMGASRGFLVRGLAEVSLDGAVVSSTRVRAALRAGDFESVNQMLGREYALGGVVEHGDGVGRKLGFPTANLGVAGLVLPPNGVYAVHALIDGAPRRAMLNIGLRPTLRDPAPRLQVEAHVLDFDGDLYDRSLDVTFVARLRDEIRFPSLEALREQIDRDIARARVVFDEAV